MTTHKKHARHMPYKWATIHRLPCYRCGKPSSDQWNLSGCYEAGGVHDRMHKPLCLDCDIELNTIIANFMKPPNWRAMLRAYIAKRMAEKP